MEVWDLKNNQGLTLIELIVVMIIMGVLVGTAVVSTKSIDRGNAKATVTRIDAFLDYIYVENMSRDKNYYLVIQKQGDAYITRIQSEVGGTRTDILAEKLKLKEGVITFTSRDASGEHLYTVNDTSTPQISLELSFAKASGAFRSSDINNDGIQEDIKRIVVTASGRSYTINLVTATGKHFIKA